MAENITNERKIALFEEEAPELLQDLAGHVLAALEKGGVDKNTAEIIAIDASADIADKWKGQQIYIPHNKGFKARLRNEQVYREFNGFNQQELARKYGVSVQWVYTVIKQMQAQEKQQRQAGKTQ